MFPLSPTWETVSTSKLITEGDISGGGGGGGGGVGIVGV